MSYSKYNFAPISSNSPYTPNHHSASTYLDFIQNRRGKKPSANDKPLFETADEKMMRIKDIIWQVADTHVPVLITGEKGVGKKTIAESIHAASSEEAPRPYLTVNCAHLPSSVLDNDLFGYEKSGGDPQRQVGKFELANNGTLVLDEITELSPQLQIKLLKVLQDKEIERNGSKTKVPIRTRVVATTNKNIVEYVNRGKFRQDLYYRLYILHLEIPPLRERLKDIQHYSNLFAAEIAREFSREKPTISDEAMQKLIKHTWYGNITELKEVLKQTMLTNSKNTIEADQICLQKEVAEVQVDWIKALPIGQPLDVLETHFILETIKNHKGNRTHAAKTLGISLRTLRNKINEYTAKGYEVMAPFNGRE